MFLLTKVNDLLKSVSAFGADKVVPHSRSCGTQTVLVWVRRVTYLTSEAVTVPARTFCSLYEKWILPARSSGTSTAPAGAGSIRMHWKPAWWTVDGWRAESHT